VLVSEVKDELRYYIQQDLGQARLAVGSKERQRDLLLERKAEIVASQQKWIDSHHYMLARYSRPSLPERYVPSDLRLVVCREQWQHDLWRLVKLTHWSMPPNEYVGRRKRILVFDGDYLFGLIGLASCIWGLTARDRWIGWDVRQKMPKLDYVVDAYVLGAVPPYNGSYRGSKMLAYVLASKEVRELWQAEYHIVPAIIVTTTLFGHSAVLNRIRHEGVKLWRHVGHTRGLGTMHFSLRTVKLAKEMLSSQGIIVPDRISAAPNWKLRLMRTAIEYVGLRAEDCLTHGYRRGVYLMQYAPNAREFLIGRDSNLELYDYSMCELLGSWEKQNLQ